MKATNVAKFFEVMSLACITYSVDELYGNTFRHHFGAFGIGDRVEREGLFLAAYVNKNSVSEETLLDNIHLFLDDAVIYKYDSPYQVKETDEKELMYIVQIKD